MGEQATILHFMVQSHASYQLDDPPTDRSDASHRAARAWGPSAPRSGWTLIGRQPFTQTT
jgi:hypothetical protein